MPDVVAEQPLEVTTPTTTEAGPELSGLDALNAAIETVEAQVDEAEAKQEGEAPEAPKAKEQPKPEPEDVFSEKALSTKQGIQAAKAKIEELRTELKKRQSKIDNFDIRLEKKTRAWEAKKSEEEQRLSNDRNIARMLQAHLGVFRTGSPEQILDSLGSLTGRSGKQVWQDLTDTMLRDGKEPPRSREVEGLKGEIAELKQLLQNQQQEREQAAQRAEQERRLGHAAQWRDGLIEQASNAETYPHLSQYVALGRGAEIARYTTQIINDLTERGEAADDSICLARIESELARALTSSAGAQKPSTGQGPAKKPGGQQAQRTPASISPSVTRSASTVREMTEEELLEAAQSDPQFMSQVFGL